MPFTGTLEISQEINHIISGHTIKNIKSLFPGFDQAGAPQLLQVSGGIGDTKTRHLRQRLDAAFTLRQQFQQFQSVRMTECFRDLCKLCVQMVFGTLVVQYFLLASEISDRFPVADEVQDSPSARD
jgi:hypothetical protein